MMTSTSVSIRTTGTRLPVGADEAHQHALPRHSRRHEPGADTAAVTVAVTVAVNRHDQWRWSMFTVTVTVTVTVNGHGHERSRSRSRSWSTVTVSVNGHGQRSMVIFRIQSHGLFFAFTRVAGFENRAAAPRSLPVIMIIMKIMMIMQLLW